MLRRWIIRSSCILPILLCLGAWGWSRSHSTWIEYRYHNRFVACVSEWGTLDVQWGTLDGHPDGWSYQISPVANAHFWPINYEAASFLGFRYFHESTPRTLTLLKAPWWFLIIVFSAILYVVWRKTRPRGTGRAFPVELTAPQSEPTDATS